MKEIEVKSRAFTYRILIEAGCLERCGEMIRKVSDSKRAVMISDDNVWEKYGSIAETSLKKMSFAVDSIRIKPGEDSKTIDCFTKVCEELGNLKVLKDDLIIALGGGVVGDLAGFVAAVYMRGLNYIQIPTTLLAQVDSSVGGKTAIDLPQGKNLIGAFHQPLLVITDPELLSTLNKKQLKQGMAEIIKYGAIKDKELFKKLEQYGSIEGALFHMEEIIYRCCDIKRGFVEQDERDNGERRKLNFGHSFGHAIEKIGNYTLHSHGEAVAMGMNIAAGIGMKLGITDAETGKRLTQILNAYELPTQVQSNYKDIVRHMAIDKKNDEKGLKLVLLKNIGQSLLYTIAEQELENILEDVLDDILELIV